MAITAFRESLWSPEWRHLVDQSKKTGCPAFDPDAPFTDEEKLMAILNRAT